MPDHAQEHAIAGTVLDPWFRHVEHDRAAARGTVAYSLGRRDYLLRRLLLAADAASILVGLAAMAAFGHAELWPQAALGVFFIPGWLAVFAAYGLYARDIKRISHSTVDDVPWLAHAVLASILLTWVYFKVLPTDRLALSDVIALGLAVPVAVLVLRSVVRRFSARALGAERVLFVGDGAENELLARKMASHPEYGLEPIGVVVPHDGQLDLEAAVLEHRPERIVLSANQLEQDALVRVVHRCRGLSIKVSLLPELFTAMGPSVEVDDVEGVTVLGINPPVLPRSSRAMKRALDLGATVLLLPLLIPLTALIAAAIKVESRGPVFFTQRRVGKGGRRLNLVKFRTMVVGAEDRTDGLMNESTDAGWLKLDHDPRITRAGRFLRLTSLDELPQFWNILKGDMSLVGPRPLIESEDRQIGGWARSRLELTPGLTGLWQVLGRTNIPFEEMVKLDYLYVTNWSLWSDIRLILRTLPAVVARRGAN
jgi:exopolysaccharide biosynthesis polyprenyl glycosylphosphotransferase